MKSLVRLTMKQLVLSLAALTIFAVSHSTARADEVHIAGFTNGCFGAACAPGSSASTLGLQFSNSTFAGTTAGGFRGLGANANPGANFNNLGSITLSTLETTYSSIPFTLQVTFTAPQGIAGSNQATAVTWPVDDVDGEVRALKEKGVTFEHYEMPNMKLEGDVHVGPTNRAAWFKDPDGNIHAVVNKR